MPRADSKSDGKRAKNARLFESIKSYRFLLLCVLAHLYTLLLVSVSGEFEQQQYHELAITYIALGSVLALGLSRAMRWSWPLFIEDTLIIIFVWALLSVLFGSYTVCNQSGTIGGTALGAPINVSDPAAQGDEIVVVHSLEESHIAETPDGGNVDDLTYWLQRYRTMTSTCDEQLFNAMYSLLVLGLLVAAVLVDLRNYWVSVLFGLATGALLLVAVLVPTNCSRFQLLDLNMLILKVTLYNLVWYLNHHRRITEDIVANNYMLTMRSLVPTLRALATPTSRKEERLMRELDERSATPVNLFDRLRRLLRYTEKLDEKAECARPTSSPSRTRRLRVRALDADSGDESESSSDDEEDMGEDESLEALQRRGRARALCEQSRELRKLQRVNDAFYNNTWFVHWLSWKNRAYNRHALRMLDLARTVWILLVCPWFLLAVAPEVLWLLWHIRINEAELQATAQMAELSHLYGERGGDFNDYT